MVAPSSASIKALWKWFQELSPASLPCLFAAAAIWCAEDRKGRRFRFAPSITGKQDRCAPTSLPAPCPVLSSAGASCGANGPIGNDWDANHHEKIEPSALPIGRRSGSLSPLYSRSSPPYTGPSSEPGLESYLGYAREQRQCEARNPATYRWIALPAEMVGDHRYKFVSCV